MGEVENAAAPVAEAPQAAEVPGQALEVSAPEPTKEPSDEGRPRTTREALERAAKDLARDDKGRFAKRPPWAQTQEERDEEILSGQESKDGEALKQSASLEPPALWPPDAKEQFRKLPAEAQRTLLERHSQMEGDYTRKTQEVARLQKQYSELDEVMSRYDEQLTQIGYTPGRLVDQFMRVQNWLERDPVRCLNWLANSYGLTFGQLAQVEQQAQSRVDPALSQLQQELYEIKSKLHQSEAQTQEAQITSLESDIAGWAEEKDGSGAPMRPHFDAVREEMVPLVQFLREKDPTSSNREILQQAYERAVWANPQTRVMVENAKKLEAAKAAKQAGVSVSGAPGGGTVTAPPKKDTRSIMEWAYAQQQRV